jgi:hypothetical protein
MRKCILFLLLLIFISSVVFSFEKDMKYHGSPHGYTIFYVPNVVLACYFKLSDFGITGYNYKIKIIGFIGTKADGPADIYVTSNESNDVPVCNPDNNWQGADYGPKSWHINNSNPNYDDCNVYNDNWHYSKDVDKFWCMYHMKTASPPYPMFDFYKEHSKNSWYWMPSTGWRPGGGFYMCDWCMHCVIVYPPEG